MPLARRHVGAGQPRRHFVARLALGHRQAAIEPVGGGQRLARRERQPAQRVERLDARDRDEPRSATRPSRGARPRARRRRGAPPPPTAPPTPPARRPAPGSRACSSKMSASSACRPLATSTSASLRSVGPCPGRSARLARSTSGALLRCSSSPPRRTISSRSARRRSRSAVASSSATRRATPSAKRRSASYSRASASRADSSPGACSCSSRQIRIAPGASCERAFGQLRGAPQPLPALLVGHAQPRAVEQQRDRARACAPASATRRASARSRRRRAPRGRRPRAGRSAGVPCASRWPARSHSRASRSIASASSASVPAAMPAASCRKSRLSGCSAASRTSVSTSRRSGSAALQLRAPRQRRDVAGIGRERRVRAAPRPPSVSWQWSRNDAATRRCRSRRVGCVERRRVADGLAQRRQRRGELIGLRAPASRRAASARCRARRARSSDRRAASAASANRPSRTSVRSRLRRGSSRSGVSASAAAWLSLARGQVTHPLLEQAAPAFVQVGERQRRRFARGDGGGERRRRAAEVARRLGQPQHVALEPGARPRQRHRLAQPRQRPLRIAGARLRARRRVLQDGRLLRPGRACPPAAAAPDRATAASCPSSPRRRRAAGPPRRRPIRRRSSARRPHRAPLRAPGSTSSARPYHSTAAAASASLTRYASARRASLSAWRPRSTPALRASSAARSAKRAALRVEVGERADALVVVAETRDHLAPGVDRLPDVARAGRGPASRSRSGRRGSDVRAARCRCAGAAAR